jgi:hypothetical protein
MKKYIQQGLIAEVTFATIFYVATFIFVLLSVVSCKKTDPEAQLLPVTVVTTPAGWNNTEFEDADQEFTGAFSLTASICNGKIPQDYDVDIWYFDRGDSPVAALDSIIHPGLDEDGEPNDEPQPADENRIQVLFSDTALTPSSNYNTKGKFFLFLSPNKLAIIRLTDKDGKLIWWNLDTGRGTGIDICL